MKKKTIKHAIIYGDMSSKEDDCDVLYLCNQAIIATPEKIAQYKKEVNCKNCIKALKKQGVKNVKYE